VIFYTVAQPGEQKRPKIKGLQPLKGLNAKATKSAEKNNHRAFRWNPFGKSAGEKRIIDLNCSIKSRICRTPYQFFIPTKYFAKLPIRLKPIQNYGNYRLH
jgi:hypothetical protein